MKLNRLATFVFALAAAGAVHAQSAPVTANIPFEFAVGGKILPAGNYTISEILSPGTIAFQQNNGNGVAIALVVQNETHNHTDTSELVFHQYGDRYFVSQIDFLGHRTTLPVTRLERELAASVHRAGRTVVAGLR